MFSNILNFGNTILMNKQVQNDAAQSTSATTKDNSGLLDKLGENFDLSNTINNLSPSGIILTMLTAVICAVIIYFVYKLFYKGVIYSENFNLLLLLITVVTAFIIMTISANLALSLGMVGALSIVRFRSAIKDPLDVGFLFWAVASGLTAGAGLYWVALIGTICIGIIYIIATILKKEKKSYLLILRYEENADAEITNLLSQQKYKLKNKTFANDKIELTVEVKLIKDDTTKYTAYKGVNGVSSVTLLEYSGEYLS